MNVPISVLMVSGGSPEMSATAVRTLKENTDKDYQLVFIDNGSAKEEKLSEVINPLLKRKDLFIRSETRISFASANNHAAKVSDGSYLLLLNNDTVTHGDWQTPLLDDGIKYDICGPTVRKLVVLEGIKAMVCHNDRGQMLDSEPDVEGAYVEGWCLFTRRNQYLAVGGLDEVFWPMYCEDSDFCFRVKCAGGKLGKVPIPIKHIGGVDTKKYVMDHYKESILMANCYKMYSRWVLGAVV